MNKLQELFTDESKWVRNVLARDKAGDVCHAPNSDDAVSWCLIGGLIRCFDDTLDTKSGRAALIRLAAAVKSVRGVRSAAMNDSRYISSFNDDPATTFADIQRVLENFSES